MFDLDVSAHGRKGGGGPPFLVPFAHVKAPEAPSSGGHEKRARRVQVAVQYSQV